jgi:acetyl esterase/lipase
MPRCRKKPLAQLEHASLRSVSWREPLPRCQTHADQRRAHLRRCAAEEQARSKARELEQFVAQSAPIRDRPEEGPPTTAHLAKAARAADVEVTLDEWSEMIHVWHAFAPGLAEANAAIEAMGTWLERRWGR